MDSIIEIIVSAATGYGTIDLYGDEPIQLNLSISNIKDISQRKGSFSQAFSAPGTKYNNFLFGNIFEITSDSLFNPNRKAFCQILVDTIPVAKGNLQLKSISVDEQTNPVYEVVFYGEQDDLIGSIGDAYLEDLDWSELNHAFTVAKIAHSWSASTAGNPQPYFYPLIDYGYDWTYNDINNKGTMSGISITNSGVTTTDLYAATNVKYIFDKIFSAAGYSYTSTFINSDLFKNQYIPFNGDGGNLLGKTFGKDRSFKASTTASTVYKKSDFYITTSSTQTAEVQYGSNPSTYQGYGNTWYTYVRDFFRTHNDSTNDNFDNGGLFDTSPFSFTSSTVVAPYYKTTTIPVSYSADTATVQRFIAVLDFRWSASTVYTTSNGPNGSSNITVKFFRQFFQNGQAPFCTQTTGLYTDAYTNQPASYYFATPWLNVYNNGGTNGYALTFTRPGERFWCTYEINHNGFLTSLNGSGKTGSTIVTINGDKTYFRNEVQNKLNAGQQLDYSLIIPKKIKQVDFVKSILTMYNIFVDIDKTKPKTLILEPRDIYFTGGTTLDWTKKLDLSKKIQEQLTSEIQSKKVIFTYKADKDFFNEDYTTKENRIYGDFDYSNDNEWLATTSEKKIDVIFSPTPLASILEGDGIIIPKIGKVDSNNVFGRTDFNLRILQKNNDSLLYLNTGSTWTLNEFITGTLVSSNLIEGYPYLGHLDHPLTGTTDLNFGEVDAVYYNNDYGLTDGNLTTLYWKKYLEEISDKNSKIITADFYLTPVDIANLNFADSIYVEGLTPDAGAYFHINKIQYSPTSNSTSTVELIKLKNKFVSRRPPAYVKGTLKGPMTGAMFGGAQTQSPGGFTSGPGTFTGPGSTGAINSGFNNGIGSSSPGTINTGSNNFLNGPGNNILGGNNNTIGEGSNNGLNAL